MTTIREIRHDEIDLVCDLYLELCRSLSERDADWGVPDRERIRRWIERTTETDEAVCLVPQIGEAAGYLVASVSRHLAMPGVSGELEELYVRPGSDRSPSSASSSRPASCGHGREAGVIRATVGLDAPWTEEELGFWASLGFEHDTTEVKHYFIDGCD